MPSCITNEAFLKTKKEFLIMERVSQHGKRSCNKESGPSDKESAPGDKEILPQPEIPDMKKSSQELLMLNYF